MSAELDKKIHNKVTSLCSEGDILLKDNDFEEAYEKYLSALELIPEPIEDWEATTFILSALGDLYFLSESYEQALEAFSDAVACPNGLGNPFIHLRLGQCQLEAGNENKATDELTRAYMGAGIEIFKNDDEKYLGFLKTKIAIQ